MRVWKAIGLAGLLGLAALGIRSAAGLERRVVARVQVAAAQAGVSVSEVRFSWLGDVRLHGVAKAGPDGSRLAIDAVTIDWRIRGGADPRAHVASVGLRNLSLRRGAVAFDVASAAFDVLAWERVHGGEHVRLRQRGGGTVDVRATRDRWQRLAALQFEALDLSNAIVRWNGRPLARPGRWSGRAVVARDATALRTEGDLALAGARFAAGTVLGADGAELGTPTDVAIAWSARRGNGSVFVERAALRSPALRVDLHGRLGGADGRVIEAEVDAEAELGGTFRAAGLRLPGPLEARPAARLGIASFGVSVRGSLDDLAALRIAPRLGFAPAPDAADSLRFLGRPFRHAALPDGTRINVSASDPDFVGLGQVPGTFVRMLLLAEDAGFFGHPGIDVAEIPAAWAENVERGGFARGASTITQQLARNLFLSREKSYVRKLEEAVLALTIDAAVPKARILEIYLNVIEWGPGVHGLLPASRHYFGKHPAQLTTREMAFLVCVVPSPVRYHSAHRAGRPGPGMEQLIDNLLAKMHAAGALGPEDYDRALMETLAFVPEGSPATIG